MMVNMGGSFSMLREALSKPDKKVANSGEKAKKHVLMVISPRKYLKVQRNHYPLKMETSFLRLTVKIFSLIG